MSRVAPARAAAFEILLAVERGAGHSDELLQQPSVEKLSQQDRNLTTNLVMGTLRWQIALDARIAAFLAKPKAPLEPPVRMALRLGAFQLLYLDRIPAYAAIGESVELAKQSGNRFAAGMVNAVLRKIAASKEKATETVTNSQNVAAQYAHPEWLVSQWVRQFGLERARAACEYDQQQPPVFVRLIAEDAERRLQDEGIELAPGNFLARVRRVVSGDMSATDLMRKGDIRIQDEGSQLIAELAGDGQQILDACAAPGGKTAILAERNRQSAITACDVSRRRLETMKRLLQASYPQVKYLAADAAKQQWQPQFDLVLCDAPCSGTGTIARNPEIRHRLQPEEFVRQRERQISILRSLMHAVKPGGRLLYSTCSLEPEENEEVVEACLKQNKDFVQLPMKGEIERLQQGGVLCAEGAERLRDTAVTDGYLRTLPGVHGGDGFFAALFVKSGR